MSTLETQAPVVSPERKRELLQFKQASDIPVEDLSLLNLAFTHRSYANEMTGDIGNNERLEFLGDSILGMVVADWLFRNMPKKHEGDFSKIKSIAVSEDSLDVVAKKLDVGTYLLMGKGEEHSGGRNKKALLADCVEALFAASYIDSGIEPARSFILKFMIPQIEAVVRNNYHHDFKTSLQEYCQHCYKKTPVYTLVDKKGPEHDFVFFVTVDVHGQAFGPAQGSTKKQAEQNAAKLAYEGLDIASFETASK
jgi:ribonuclease-3